MERTAARREKRRSQLCPIPSRHAIRRTSSPNSASDRWPIVSRLTELVGNRGMTLFAVMDQSGEARLAGLQLRDTTLVIFGSPVQVTPVVASPAPKVMVQRQRRETRSPVLPKVLYCMVFPIPWTALSQARARRLGRSLQLKLSREDLCPTLADNDARSHAGAGCPA